MPVYAGLENFNLVEKMGEWVLPCSSIRLNLTLPQWRFLQCVQGHRSHNR
jgi:hypothetical protein